jgi:thiol:disulfide interchange protein
MPRPIPENHGSHPWHLVDDVLRSIESLGTKEGLISFAKHLLENPLIIGFFLLAIKVFWTFSKQVPEVTGHRVRSIKSVDEWNKLLKEAKVQKKIIVCHFYAAWAPTCKMAGRIFQKMSIGEYGFS